MLENQKNDPMDMLQAFVGSTSDYPPKTLDEARNDLLRRAKETVTALRKGDVRPYHPAPMARQQRNTKKFCVKIGYGGNNAYMANPVHKASQALKFDTAEEAASVLEDLIVPLVKSGEFDASLNTTLEAHKARAEARIAAAAQNRKALKEGIQDDVSVSPKAAA